MPVSFRRRFRPKDIPLVLTALFWVCWVRLGLSLSSLEKTRRRLLPKTLAASHRNPDLDRMAWSVRRTANMVPMATCLTRAQALQIMLARRGLSTDMVLGVARSASKDFLAHAWLEKDGQVLIGGAERKINTFSRLKTYGPTSK